MAEPTDNPIEFIAAIPDARGAIRIDGADGDGGRVILEVPGTDIAPLLKLTTLRGKRLLITARILLE